MGAPLLEKRRTKRDDVPLVRTWRERAGLPTTFPLEFATPVERAMVEEIAELRETLEALLWPNRVKVATDPRQMDIEDNDHIFANATCKCESVGV